MIPEYMYTSVEGYVADEPPQFTHAMRSLLEIVRKLDGALDEATVRLDELERH